MITNLVKLNEENSGLEKLKGMRLGAKLGKECRKGLEEIDDGYLKRKAEDELDDLDQFPAVLSECIEHEQASRVGADDKNSLEVCRCCGY